MAESNHLQIYEFEFHLALLTKIIAANASNSFILMSGIPDKFVKSGLNRQTFVPFNSHLLFVTGNQKERSVEKEDQSSSYSVHCTS